MHAVGESGNTPPSLSALVAGREVDMQTMHEGMLVLADPLLLLLRMPVDTPDWYRTPLLLSSALQQSPACFQIHLRFALLKIMKYK